MTLKHGIYVKLVICIMILTASLFITTKVEAATNVAILKTDAETLANTGIEYLVYTNDWRQQF